MGEQDGGTRHEDGGGAAHSERVRRPVPERTMPHRGWQNLYTLGSAADAAAQSTPAPPPGEDGAARVVRDGYRTLEENLRRGRQAAEDLHEASAGTQALTLGVNSRSFVSSFARAFFDPALTRPFVDVARSWINVFSLPTRFERAAAERQKALAMPPERIPFHPQQRAQYRAPDRAAAPRSGAPQLLGLSALRPGEWVGDLAIDGRVRRVQIRELEEL